MEIDLQLFKNIMREGRHNTDLLDSFSPNQFKSKEMLIKMVNDLNMVDSNSEIVILGGWYGSILIPAFKYVKRITLIDLNDQVIGLAKRRLFNHYDNVDFITSDVWNENRLGRIQNANLIINTSCEHMRPMKELKLDTNAYFAYQSNNMRSIKDHINCVGGIDEFQKQLPDNARVLDKGIIEDERGLRFTLVGKYEKINL
tara:strand:+ start:1000 stop:1599 length:600 start_codon:yes stop_codon:yes gene_type:complete